jgi:hypothetical protein
MQRKPRVHGNSLLRKIVVIVFLPVFIGAWITGWTLAIIGDRAETARRPSGPLYSEVKAYERGREPAEGDSRRLEEQIVA